MDPAPLNKTTNYYFHLNDMFPFQLDITIDGNEIEILTRDTFEYLVAGEESPKPAKISIIQDQNSTHLHCFDLRTFNACGGIQKPNPSTREPIERVFDFQYAGENRFVKIQDQNQEQSIEKKEKPENPSIKIEVEKLFTPVKVTNALIYSQDIQTKNPKTPDNPFPEIIALTFENQKYQCFDAALLGNNQELQKITNISFFRLSFIPFASEAELNYKWLHKKQDLTEIIKVFYQALAGNKEAEVKLGDYYRDKKNQEEARLWYASACAHDSLQGYIKLGCLYLDKEKTIKNFKAAERMFRVALNKNPKNEEAKIKLAFTLTKLSQYKEAFDLVKSVRSTEEVEYVRGVYYHLATTDKPAKSILYNLNKSSEAGFTDATNALGEYYAELGEFKMAFKLFNEAANKGNPFADYNLYFCYRDGDEIKADPKKALEYLKKAVHQGVPNSAYHLGIMLAYANGIDNDKKESLKVLKEAADSDDPIANYFLGLLYFEEKNEVMAVKYLQEAARLEHKDAAFKLSRYYSKQNNEQKTIEFLELASKLDHKEAQFYIGNYYFQKNTKEDGNKAIEYFKKGHLLKDIKSIKALANCYRKGIFVRQNIFHAKELESFAAKLENAKA